ncbi:hypothetical protein AG1IA_03675 [Rhizoctonia solani AG-1 IA]|uniref:Uncharacterized protein n=1 Tax=Thanatephorus cucumeris (strain AG1-IA) TaxID=983506 RepID=L8WWF6_THACA|nr:hypothetical protein AG1IA_03675 [Rhizoctonia solani AG-1 IA]
MRETLRSRARFGPNYTRTATVLFPDFIIQIYDRKKTWQSSRQIILRQLTKKGCYGSVTRYDSRDTGDRPLATGSDVDSVMNSVGR